MHKVKYNTENNVNIFIKKYNNIKIIIIKFNFTYQTKNE